MLREVCVDGRPWLRSPEGYKQWLVCQVLAARLYRLDCLDLHYSKPKGEPVNEERYN